MAGVRRWKSKMIARALEPHPLQTWTLDFVQKRGIGSYEWRLEKGAVERPAYGYCVNQAARLARRLGIPRISVIAFGVAGGSGLLALERHAERISKSLDVKIDIYGFDTGRGLPPVTDYRDLPYHWKAGFFEMDQEALRSRLKQATLILGDVDQTLGSFVKDHDPAPIGAVMHDMDLYSSTWTGLKLFDIGESYRLPRICTYFDDIVGDEWALYNDYTGERLAIAEFNEAHEMQKICQALNLSLRASRQWHHQIYVLHDFAHSRYNEFVSRPNQQLPLAGS
jgi:hypothetical protein